MFLKRFWSNESGNAAIILSLSAVPLFVGAGIAVDYANWRYQETQLQSVADSAALAGAVAYSYEGNSKKDQSQAEARATAAINGYIAAHHAELNAPPQITFEQDPQAVEANFSETGLRTLSSLLPGSDTNIRVTAKAVISAITTSPCVVGLNETAAPAVRFSGSGPMTAENCAVWSNSTQSVAMEGSGSGAATASMFCAVGGVLGGSTTFSTPPQSNCPPVEDPLASMDMPTIGACDHNNLQINTTGTVPVTPGVYCGGLKLTSSAILQLAPGEYIIKDGPLETVGGASLEGTGVTIFMTGTNSGLKLGGASSINISAPISGTYAGVALDYSNAVSKKKSLQAIADAAAIAGAREMTLANATVTQIQSVTRQIVTIKTEDAQTTPKVHVTVNEADASVKVDLQQDWAPYFMGLVSRGAKQVNASATAQIAGTGKVCMIGLHTTMNRAVHLKKNAILTANECGVYSNSTSTSSIKIDADGQMTASHICAAGGVSGLSSAFNPYATTDCPALPDPLTDRNPPTIGALCDHTNYAPTGPQVTATPGVYCGGIAVPGSTTINFEPGVYVIKDGPLEVQATAQVVGTNVGFYLVGAMTEIRFGPNSTVSLTAPRDGEMAGLLFYEDRNNPADMTHRISSNNARMLLGTLYFPVNPLTIDANAPVADQSAYTAIVVRSLTLDAGPNLVLNSDYGATDIPIPGALSGDGGRIILAE